MRKKNYIVIMFVSIILLTGCTIKEEYITTINSDKTANFEVIQGLDKEGIIQLLNYQNSNTNYNDYSNEDLLAELKKLKTTNNSENDYSKFGFTCNDYASDNIIGEKCILKISNIDDLINNKEELKISELKEIKNKLFLTKNNDIYSLNIINDLTEDSNYNFLKAYNSIMDYKFILNIPAEPIETNATSVSENGKTLTWNLLKGGNITAAFRLKNENNIEKMIKKILENKTILIGLIAIILIILILTIISITTKIKNKRNKKPDLMAINDNTTK